VKRSDGSELVRAMIAPADFYAHDDDATARRSLPARLAMVMLSLGAFVSFTTAGRLSPWHLVGTALGWSFLPLLQLASMAVAMRAGVARRGLVETFSGHLAGYGPWLLLLGLVDAVCLVARDVFSAFATLARTGVLPICVVATIVWSVLLQRALLRASVHRAGRATAVYYAVFVALVVGWYIANGDLLPLLGVFL
jgi:hypothetical protein